MGKKSLLARLNKKPIPLGLVIALIIIVLYILIPGYSHLNYQDGAPPVDVQVAEKLLSQQEHIINWFALIATITLTLMAVLTGFGYFNSNDVRKRIEEIEAFKRDYQKELAEHQTEFKIKIDQFGSIYKPFTEKYHHFKSFIDRLDEVKKSTEKHEIPDSIDAISVEQQKSVKENSININILKYAAYELNTKDHYILALDFYLAGLYEKSLSEISMVDLVKKNDLIQKLLSYLSGKIFYNKKDFTKSAEIFLNNIFSDYQFLIAHFYYVDSIIQQNGDKNPGSIKDVIFEQIDRFGQENNCASKNELLKKISLFYFAQQFDPLKQDEYFNDYYETADSNSIREIIKLELLAQQLLNDRTSFDSDDDPEKSMIDNHKQFIETIQDALRKGKEIKHFIRFESPVYQEYKKASESEMFLKDLTIDYRLL
jgi:TolA-binding protein